ncbi:MAG: AbrB family transcriptional regulator, partial [Beijerinckiaceae bacterium]
MTDNATSPLSTTIREWAGQLPAIVCAFMGGLAFEKMGLPAPWVSGSMLGAMASGLFYRLRDMPFMMRELSLLIAGMTMGSAVTPQTVDLIVKMPASFVLLMACMITTILAASAWLTHVHHWRRDDAMLASAPGALSSVLAIAHARNGDIPGIVVVQTVRLFVLVAVLPGLINALEKGGGAPVPFMGWLTGADLAVMTVLSVALGWLLHRTGLAAAMLISGAIVSATLHGAGIYTAAMPQPIAVAGFVMIGAMIASRMNAVTLAALRQYLVSSLFVLAIAIGIACAYAWLAATLVNVRFGAALLAFAPGGLEAMSLLSIALALDPLYVG